MRSWRPVAMCSAKISDSYPSSRRTRCSWNIWLVMASPTAVPEWNWWTARYSITAGAPSLGGDDHVVLVPEHIFEQGLDCVSHRPVRQIAAEAEQGVGRPLLELDRDEPDLFADVAQRLGMDGPDMGGVRVEVVSECVGA